MNKKEFRNLIKEEIKKVLNEGTSGQAMELSDLKKIQASKPGDMVTVQSDWSPSGIKMVQVKLLDSFKKLKGPGFFGAFADYKGRLERVTIDYNNQTAFIGGNWDEEYDESFLDAIALKYKLRR